MRGLVVDADLALQLLGGDPASSARHQVDRVEPQLERRRRLVEDRPGGRVDVVPARVAVTRRAILHPVELPFASHSGQCVDARRRRTATAKANRGTQHHPETHA